MSFLSGILSNPAIKNAAFGFIKDLIKEKNLEFIVLRLDGDGEIVLDMYDKDEAAIVPKILTVTPQPATENEGAKLVEMPVKKTVQLTTKKPVKNNAKSSTKRRGK